MRIPVEPLRRLVVDIFIAAGTSPAEADRIAHHLVKSDLAGHPSHGVVRVRGYVDRMEDGSLVAGRTVETVTENEVLLVLDGGYGFGQTVGGQAVEAGLARAEDHGVAVVGLRHSGHLGRIADWAEIAAERGLVSIHFVNATSIGLVAPYGGVARRFGTNPIAIVVPQVDDDGRPRPPVLVDFATSVVAEGKAKVAMNGGAPVPTNALISASGEVTGDTAVLYGDVPEGEAPNPRHGTGALRAFGDQKGSALALACELLAGVLLGSGTSGSEPFCNGMLSFYLSPDHFAAPAFAAEACAFADHVRAATPATPGGRVLVPGDLERELADEQRRKGIDLAEGTWADLAFTAAKVGVEPPDR